MHFKEILLEIQDRLFTAESMIARDPEAKIKVKLPELRASDIELLEKEIDAMNEVLPDLKNFILPGGHPVVSYCHIARCICRRAERLTIKLSQLQPLPDYVVPYLNRLSDYLFVLTRCLSYDAGIEEIKWLQDKKPK